MLYRISILGDNGKWNPPVLTQKPEFRKIYENGELKAILLILRDGSGRLVARRLVERHSF